MRIKLLAKQMIRAIEILDTVEAKAFDIYAKGQPSYEWVKEFQASNPGDLPALPNASKQIATITSAEKKVAISKPAPSSSSGLAQPLADEDTEGEVEDLIDIKLREWVVIKFVSSINDLIPSNFIEIRIKY